MKYSITKRSILSIVTATSLCALATVAQGGQKISLDGVQYYMAQFQTVQFEKGHNYSMLKEWRGIHAAKDLASLANLTRMECHGYVDSKPDGSFSAEGYCNHWDRDGDLWVGHWWNNSKMPAGRYEFLSGEGKYVGATGGGTAKCNFLKPGPDAQAACEVTGMIELK